MAFTILESMVTLLIASLLITVLLASLISVKACYDRVMAVAVMQDDGRFAINNLRRKIHAAGTIEAIFDKNSIPTILKSKLEAISDVLLLKNNKDSVAYYIAKTSWTRQNKTVYALFEKPMDGHRVELVSDVVGFDVKSLFGGVSYDVTIQSTYPVLQYTSHFVDRFLRRTWHGFARVKQHDHT